MLGSGKSETMWQNTERKFANNLKKHKISTRKNLKNVTQQSKPGDLTVPEQEERAGHLHHNYKKQQKVPSTHHATTIKNHSGIQILL